MQQLTTEWAAGVLGVGAERRRVLERLRAVALGEQVLVERGHLDDLPALAARQQRGALLPKVEVERLLVEGRVEAAAELARLEVLLLRRPHLGRRGRRPERRPAGPLAEDGRRARLWGLGS